MKTRRLLDRIRHYENHPQERTIEDPKQVIHSIREHLQRILNTRQGDAPIAEDYGIPDFTDFKTEFPESVRDFERSIRQTIQKYEPRLRAVRVNFVPPEEESLAVSFQIHARLEMDGEAPIVFESMLDADGKVRITR